jgi:hypothetical protein
MLLVQFNLAWKLALVINGLARPRLLDTYTAERTPVIAEMLRRSTAVLEATFRGEQDKAEKLRRDPAMSQLSVNYEWSPVVYDERRDGGRALAPEDPYGGGRRGLWAGDRAPEAPELRIVGGAEHVTSVFDLIDLAKHTIFVFVGKDAAAEDVRPFLDVVGHQPSGTCKTVLVFEDAPKDVQMPALADTSVVDTKGYAAQFYEVKDGVRAVVVRPDAVASAIVKTPAGLVHAFGLVFDAEH